MTPPPYRLAQAGYATLLASTFFGAFLLALGVWLYPGGTVFKPQGAGSFWLNFLCDVTAAVALNGVGNAAGSACAIAAIATIGVGLGCFWSLLPQLLRRDDRTIRVARALGWLSLLGLGLAPFTTGRAHVLAVLGGAFPGLVAGSLATMAVWREPADHVLRTVSAGTILAAFIDACLYVQSYLHAPRVVVPALPVLQKVALLFLLAWMSMLALRGLRQSEASRPKA
jgi:hypothetical protein